jgi:hypothetical protein
MQAGSKWLGVLLAYAICVLHHAGGVFTEILTELLMSDLCDDSSVIDEVREARMPVYAGTVPVYRLNHVSAFLHYGT